MAPFCGFFRYFAIIHFLSAEHRHQNPPSSDFLKFPKSEFTGMKALSVLFTLGLLIAANLLAVHLRRVHVLPLNAHGNPAPVAPVTLASSQFPQPQP